MLKIGTGTKSKHKIGAIEAACILVGATAEITGDETETNVPAQPKGFAQILRGAKNRARASRKLRPELDVWMGIEIGILEEIDDEGVGVSIDVAVIVILFGDGENDWVYSLSPGVTFPQEYIDAWSGDGRRGTVGEIIATRIGGSSTDPHSALTGGRLTRAQTLVDGVKAALLQLRGELLHK